MIATQQIAGNNSGAFLRTPRIVVMHATRSGQDWTDAEELNATLNWFVNPDGASSHWVISEKERVRVVQDILIAWHSAYLNSRSWGIELTQPTNEDFTDGHYANVALIGQSYVKLGVAPVWLDYWDGGDASGFVAHQDTKQGREVGKTDPGPKFDRARFIASLEGDMDEAEVRRIARNEVIDAFEFEAGVHGATKPFLSGKHTLREWMGILIEHKDDAAKHSAGGASQEQMHGIAKDEIDLARVKAAR